MFKSILKITTATLLFAGIHSLFASKAVKRSAARLIGKRKRNALYRPFYNVQAITTFGGLLIYGVGLKDHELYKIRGPIAWLMRIIQLYFLIFLLDGVRQIGFLNFAGVPNIIAWILGESQIPKEPEGQGPVLRDNKMKISGPFRFSRHPLNFGMIPILWLMPRMTVNLASFNLITTLYLLIGSIHEEKRLKEEYGVAFKDYRQSGVNFFIPSSAYSVIAFEKKQK